MMFDDKNVAGTSSFDRGRAQMSICQSSICSLEPDSQNLSGKFPVGRKPAQSCGNAGKSQLVEGIGHDARVHSSKS